MIGYTLGLIALIMVALFYRRALPNATNRFDYELESHRQMLAQLERDAAMGALSDADAQALILDVQRRILRLHKTDTVSQTPKGMSPYRLAMLSAITLICAAIGYGYFGNRSLSDKPSAPPLRSDPALVQAAQTARAALLRDPSDATAWVDLSRALIVDGKGLESLEALNMATRAWPEKSILWVAYGQALVHHAGGDVSPAARYAFERAHALDTRHPGPRVYLALAWLQAGHPEQALPLLDEIARTSPPHAIWMPQVRRMQRGARAMIAAGVGQNNSLPSH